MTDTERLADLKRKLAKRQNAPGFEENVEELKREIAALESQGATHS